MSISYGEIAVISAMTNEDLVKRYYVLDGLPALKPLNEQSQDVTDEISVIENEMESRGLPHP